jgi:tetratricopeptide (TPR) repeat protein
VTSRRITLVLAAALAALPARAFADDAATHAEHAQALYNVGKFAEAAAELETAYQLDPENTRILFNLAQAYRMAGDFEKAAFELHRYLEDPRADEKPEAQRRLAEVEAELNVAAEKAAAIKATQDELARTKDALAKAQAQVADLQTPKPEKLHVALESGNSLIYLVGAHTHTTAQHGRLRWMFVLYRGDAVTLEHGPVITFNPIPYTATDGSGQNAVWTTITYDVEARGDLSKHWFVQGGLGAGFGDFAGMKDGNPFGMNGAQLSNTGNLVARADLMFGYRWTHAVSSVVETSVTVSTKPDGFRMELSGPLAHDYFTLGLHVFL